MALTDAKRERRRSGAIGVLLKARHCWIGFAALSDEERHRGARATDILGGIESLAASNLSQIHLGVVVDDGRRANLAYPGYSCSVAAALPPIILDLGRGGRSKLQMFRALRTIQRPISIPLIPFRALSSFHWRPMEVVKDTAPAAAGGAERNGSNKRPFQNARQGRGNKRQKIFKPKPVKEGSSEEVLIIDVAMLFTKQSLNETAPVEAEGANGAVENGQQVATPAQEQLPEPFTEIDVKVLEISSTGDGLAVGPGKTVYVVPFTAPGDVARVKVIKHFHQNNYTLTDFLSIVTPGPLRDDARINCKYFSSCSGCQFQMLDYATQLAHKKTIVEKAYKNFSSLPSHLVPAVIDTMGSPLQYEYRTKLTPHFDGPPGHRARGNRGGPKPVHEVVPPIGFMQKGRRVTLDIEDCPIGTPAVRLGMKRERTKYANEIAKYSKGVTILLRESTERVPTAGVPEIIPEDVLAVAVPGKELVDLKSCISDSNAVSHEYIDSADASYTFTNIAGEFFQNNNSILPPFTQYIRENILPPTPNPTDPPVQYLIDAYSGSGLFTITLSSQFKSSMGIDVSAKSIKSAGENARLNGISPSKASFMAADAAELFEDVTFPADETVILCDPPRKGCDDVFLRQLLAFRPKRVVYVSCNVHTQARDIGVLVHGYKNGKDAEAGVTRPYKIESLRGFDFFPQTGHVEGVAVLSRDDDWVAESPKVAEAVSEVPKEVIEKDVADAEAVIATGAVSA